MAEQLHYTSAATGLSGRPGFQFVAASPGATPAVQQAVAPYLAYRPPPAAPSQPTAEQLAAFPVSYSFVCQDATAILAQCRYLGTDYSGRYGNFLGHAVVARLPELGDRPPIALWRSPIWAVAPAGTAGAELPELGALPSGEGIDREAVAGWLAGTGGHQRLAELIEAVLATLAGRAGQVILVAGEVETVARWIAAVSYSLPLAWAQRLSFVTYTGDINRAQQHLVGTTTDAWTGGTGHGRLFRLDQPAAAGATGEAGWYASALAGAWRDRDLYQLDVLNELVTTLAAGGNDLAETDRDPAAALAALCRGDRLAGGQLAAVAGLLIRWPERLPPWVWDDLTSRLAAPDRFGLDFVLAVHEAAGRAGRDRLAEQAGVAAVRLAIGEPRLRPRLAAVRLPPAAAAGLTGELGSVLRAAADLAELCQVVREAQRLAIPLDLAALRSGAGQAVVTGPGRVGDLLRAVPQQVQWAAVLQGVVDGLGGADDARIAAVLTDDVCDLLSGRDWEAAPRVGAQVYASRGRRHPAEREAATALIADLADRGLLADPEMGRRVREIWRAGTPSLALCRRLLDQVTGPQQAHLRGVVALSRQAFAAGDLATAEAHALAERLAHVLGGDPTDPAVADAIAVATVHRATADAADAYQQLSDVEDVAQPVVFRRAMAVLVKTYPAAFAGASPATKAEVLRRMPAGGELRRRLVEVLMEPVDRAERGAALNLAHVAAVLWHAGVPDKQLTARAARLLNRADVRRNLLAGLERRDPRLRGWFEQMIEHHDQSSLWRRASFRRRRA